MTEEKVKQGEELLKSLDKLKDQRKMWEEGMRFYKVELANTKEYDSRQSTFRIDSSFINFDEVKLLIIAKIDKRISEVQEKFDRL